MYSFIAFLVTFGQLAIALWSYAAGAQETFYFVVVYGSPFYLAMNLLTQFSLLLDTSPAYVAMAGYHLLKYFLFFRAQVSEERNLWLMLAILFEAAYLGLSGYYLN